MNIDCPHCGKPINLVGATELANEYGLKSNSVQHYRTRGFPEPVLRFGNRYVYLRGDVEKFAAARSQQKIDKAVEALMRDLDHVPEEARVRARQRLIEELASEKKPPKRRGGRKQSTPRGKKGGLDSA